MPTTTAKRDVAKRIHRDVFPITDHGYTWTECFWYEADGARVSAIVPCGGCNERLGTMPGGPIPLPDWEWEERNVNVVRTVKSEETHDGFYRVGTVSITKARD